MAETPPLPDWVRLQRALSVEAETGFNNLVGKQQSFCEFLRDSLQQPPAILPVDQRPSWQSLAQKYDGYIDLSFAQRQHLVAETRRFLHGTQRLLEKHAETKALRTRERSSGDSSGEAETKPTRQPKAAKTTPLVAATDTGSFSFGLDQPVTYLKGIGPKNGERLAKLGLLTVQDVLYYYPRDHINYAQQVKIRDLAPGETVTIVGTVKRVNCFTSPRNKKLTIFELQLSDGSGTFTPATAMRPPVGSSSKSASTPRGRSSPPRAW